jgi:mitogen-activated protein kinase organizer 1
MLIYISWDVTSGNILKRFSGHVHRINHVALNKEATLLFSASYDATVKIWDCRYSIKLYLLKGVETQGQFRHWIMPRIVSPQSWFLIVRFLQRTIFSVVFMFRSIDGKIRMYDIRMGNLVTDNVASNFFMLTK